jgi:hypothetical protein
VVADPHPCWARLVVLKRCIYRREGEGGKVLSTSPHHPICIRSRGKLAMVIDLFRNNMAIIEYVSIPI